MNPRPSYILMRRMDCGRFMYVKCESQLHGLFTETENVNEAAKFASIEALIDWLRRQPAPGEYARRAANRWTIGKSLWTCTTEEVK